MGLLKWTVDWLIGDLEDEYGQNKPTIRSMAGDHLDGYSTLATDREIAEAAARSAGISVAAAMAQIAADAANAAAEAARAASAAETENARLAAEAEASRLQAEADNARLAAEAASAAANG